MYDNEASGNVNDSAPDFGAVKAAQVGKAADAAAQNIVELAGNWHNGEGTYGINPDTRQMLSNASNAITEAAAALRASHEEAYRYMNDDRLYPPARQRMAQEAVQAGKETASNALAAAEALAIAGEKLLIAESAPSLGDTASQRAANLAAAKSDIQMVVNSDSGDMIDKLSYMAQLDSPISAVLTSDWLDLLLVAKGVKPVDRQPIITAVQEKALAARAARGSKEAKLAYAVRSRMRGAIGATKSLAQH